MKISDTFHTASMVTHHFTGKIQYTRNNEDMPAWQQVAAAISFLVIYPLVAVVAVVAILYNTAKSISHTRQISALQKKIAQMKTKNGSTLLTARKTQIVKEIVLAKTQYSEQHKSTYRDTLKNNSSSEIQNLINDRLDRKNWQIWKKYEGNTQFPKTYTSQLSSGEKDHLTLFVKRMNVLRLINEQSMLNDSSKDLKTLTTRFKALQLQHQISRQLNISRIRAFALCLIPFIGTLVWINTHQTDEDVIGTSNSKRLAGQYNQLISTSEDTKNINSLFIPTFATASY